MGSHLRVTLFLALLAPLAFSCRSETPEPVVRNQNATSTPDRLLPGEELPGRKRVFGIEVPPGLVVSSRFPEVVQLTGHVKLDSVLNVFRKQLVAEHIELGNQRAVFPRARVKGDEKKRVLRVEMVSSKGRVDVVIRDVTEPPVAQGLDEKERWDRAGRNPDGTLKDRLKVY